MRAIDGSERRWRVSQGVWHLAAARLQGVWHLAAASLCAAGCALDLDDGGAAAPVAADTAVAGCVVAVQGEALAQGRLVSLRDGLGGLRWLVAERTLPTGAAPAGGDPDPGVPAILASAATWTEACPPTLSAPIQLFVPLPEPGGGGPAPRDVPQSALGTPQGLVVFYRRQVADAAAPFGLRIVGYGVAVGAAPPLQPGPPIWAGDRPAYGLAALAHGGEVFAYGCAPAGFLAADCFIARAPVAAVADPAAWRYEVGGGQQTTDVEAALPAFHAGGGLGVAFEAARDRVVVAYSDVLGDGISVRTGLTPAGPFSAARRVGRLAAPPGAFVVDLALHAALDLAPAAGANAAGATELALSWTVGSFDVALTPAARALRMARLRIPVDLP